MKGLTISIEGVSPELLDVYVESGMIRGYGGAAAVEWAFKSNPNAFVVARADGRVVGLSAYVLSRMKFGSAIGKGLQAVDSFVIDEMRGRGVFTQLARAYEEHVLQSGADLVWGFPNDNAASAWFRKLGWRNHGQVPFLVKPLRAGFFLRKLGLPADFPVNFDRDQNLAATTEIGDWANLVWERVAHRIGCGTVRNREFLSHRLFQAPQADSYRLVIDENAASAAYVATREANKHGGRIAYLMEGLGGESLQALLRSELGRLRNRGVEMVLAWSFPWSPNYGSLRRAGFLPLPERLRPIRIWFGGRPQTAIAGCANEAAHWYLSYLDSDTV